MSLIRLFKRLMGAKPKKTPTNHYQKEMSGIVFGNGEFGYKFIPKNACTSIKNALYEAEEGLPFQAEKGRHIHNFYYRRELSLNNCSKRFIVIRDPIKRFLSAYSNRVEFHRDLSIEKISLKQPEITQDIPVFDPSLDQFIENLERYLSVNAIKHHIEPVTDILGGHPLSFFTNIYRLEDISAFQKDLSYIFNKEIVFGREQTGGRKIPVSTLNREQIDFLINFFQKDYELLSDYYTIDAIYDEWQQP